MEAIRIDIRFKDFDVRLLSVDETLLRNDEKIFRTAIQAYFRQVFDRMSGESRVTFYDDYVSVLWTPHSQRDLDAMIDWAVDLLKEGDRNSASVVLGALAQKHPDNPVILYNYGMLLSDQGQLDDATQMLSKLVQVEPQHANGWTALGVAFSRQGKRDQATVALEKSLEIDPRNGYALRNLGSIVAKAEPQKAKALLKTATEVLPMDQAAQYAYGLCLFEAMNSAEADGVLKTAIDLDEYSEIAELCRQLRTRIAHQNMRSATPGGVRMDVVMYCLAAIEKFKQLGPQQAQAITFEIAILGRGGLDINNSGSRYNLRSMPGEFTGLQLVSYMYVGLKQIAPQQEAGIDLSKEYAAALQMFTAQERAQQHPRDT